MNYRILFFLAFYLVCVPSIAQQAQTLTATDSAVAPPVTASGKSDGNVESDAIVKRVGDDIRYLASDELEGRGPQTKGLELAAKHIEEVFVESGLVGGGDDGTFRKPFEIPVDTQVSEKDTLLVFQYKWRDDRIEGRRGFPGIGRRWQWQGKRRGGVCRVWHQCSQAELQRL